MDALHPTLFSIHNFSSPNFKFILLQYCFFFPKVIEYKCMLRNINSFSRPYDIFKSYSSYALCQKKSSYTLSKILFLPSRVFFHHFCQNEYIRANILLLNDEGCWRTLLLIKRTSSFCRIIQFPQQPEDNILRSLFFEYFAQALSCSCHWCTSLPPLGPKFEPFHCPHLLSFKEHTYLLWVVWTKSNIEIWFKPSIW